jgi:hypothetical protein
MDCSAHSRSDSTVGAVVLDNFPRDERRILKIGAT